MPPTEILREQLKERINAHHILGEGLTVFGPLLDGEARQVQLPPDIPEWKVKELVELAKDAYLVGHAEGCAASAAPQADRAELPTTTPLATYTARAERDLGGRHAAYECAAPSLESALKGLRALMPPSWNVVAEPPRADIGKKGA